MAKKVIRILALALILLATVIPAVPVSAIDAPDSDMQLTNVWVNRHLISANDMLVYFMYNIPYATSPDVPADQAYMFMLYDTDGTTLLGAGTPYPKNDYGYNYGFGSLYFDADEAPTWDQAYTLKLVGNPTQFTGDVPEASIVLDSSYYSLETSQTTNRDEAETNIASILSYLDLYWETSEAYGTNLLTRGVDSYVLDVSGQSYMAGAMPGGSFIVPDLYQTSISTPDYSGTASDNWTHDQADIYEARFDAYPWVGNFTSGVGELLGGDSTLGGGMVVAGFAIFVFLWAVFKYKSTMSGASASILILMCGFMLGWLPYMWFGAILFFIAVYTGIVIFYNRST